MQQQQQQQQLRWHLHPRGPAATAPQSSPGMGRAHPAGQAPPPHASRSGGAHSPASPMSTALRRAPCRRAPQPLLPRPRQSWGGGSGARCPARPRTSCPACRRGLRGQLLLRRSPLALRGRHAHQRRPLPKTWTHCAALRCCARRRPWIVVRVRAGWERGEGGRRGALALLFHLTAWSRRCIRVGPGVMRQAAHFVS